MGAGEGQGHLPQEAGGLHLVIETAKCMQL